jgi:hypothetical protein
MIDRRHALALGASSLLTPFARVSAAQPTTSRLETRLFNLNDDTPPEKAAELVANLKAAAQSSGIGGFMVGRNFIPNPFPARFEWIYMVQFDSAAPVLERFAAARDILSSHCRNQVTGELNCPLPPRYADAAGVGVRHTVMFNFKPDATEDDRKRNVDAIREMGKLPMVRSYLVQPGAASPSDPSQMQWQVVGDFASVADYKAYAAAPVHLAIREDFVAHTSRVAFLDAAL